MKAIVMHQRGAADVLKYEDVPDPKPGRDEVLIKVHAATVNHTDIFHRNGQFYIQKELPHILGMDVAGEIIELGENVKDWKQGDRVVATFEALGRERNGAYAEYTILPVSQLHRIPQGLDYVAAASIGLAFTTAWMAMLKTDQLNENERVVITAASSGVGTAALQIAKWKRAIVVAISEMSKADRLSTLGADIVIGRNAKDQVQRASEALNQQGATFILELVGKSTLQSSIRMLATGGRIVCVGTLSGDIAEVNIMDLIMKRGIIKGSFSPVTPDEFEKVLYLFADKTFEPVIDCVLPLAEAKAAHARIEAKEGFGKIILVP